MTPEKMAEAFERARYEQLRGQQWSDLRDGERAARSGVALQALEDSGITTLTDQWRITAEKADELAAVVVQRDAEIARRRAEHDAEITSLTAAHDGEVAGLTEQIAALRLELAETLDRAHGAESGAAAAKSVIAAVRSALSAVPSQADQRALAHAGPAAASSIDAARVSGAPDRTGAQNSAHAREVDRVAPGGTTAAPQPAQPASTTPAQAMQRPAPAPAKNRFAKARMARAGATRG